MAFGKCSEFTIPIIADVSKEVANAYGMMDPDEMDAQVRPGLVTNSIIFC